MERRVSEQSSVFYATTQFSYYENKDEGILCFSKPSSTSSRRDCHLTQSKLCFYLCVYSFSLSTSIQESCCNKILQNVQLWCITLKFVESLKTVCFPLSQSTYISRRPLSVPLCIQPCIALTLMIPPPKQKKKQCMLTFIRQVQVHTSWL